MTFSQYINKYAYKNYLEFCKLHNLRPEVDIKEFKLCALVKPPINKND